MVTKKQIKALKDIIANRQYAVNNERAAVNEERKKKILPPLEPYVCGETKTPTGYQVTDGYAGVYYRDSIPELPHDDSDESSDLVRNLISEDGDYLLVTAPFGGVISSSKIRQELKANSQSMLFDKLKLIQLRAQDSTGREIKGTFNSKYVQRAVEAVGGNVRLYIGFSKVRPMPAPYLIVEPDDGYYDLDVGKVGIHAIVMPTLQKV